MSSKRRPTVISTFAGCGGSSLGYKQAGATVLLSVEWEQNACEVYRLNHPHTDLIEGDIRDISAESILKRTKLQPGALDIFDGSPPCQGFSTAGKREVTDPRNQLFQEYVRLLNALQPKAFVMENVPGLVRGSMKPTFKRILDALIGCGYTVQASVLSAQDYGVPQARQRVFMVGTRKDLGVSFHFPKPTHRPILFHEAVEGLKPSGGVLKPKGQALEMAGLLREGEDGGKLRKRYGAKFRDFSLKRLHRYKVAPTICKTIRPGQCGLLHPTETRFLSTAELRRLASFPDDYQFIGSLEEQWARIGNCVPPKLMEAVASSVIKALNNG